MSMKDIIHSMGKYFAHDLFKEALEEFRKLQDIEEQISQDKNLVYSYAMLHILKFFAQAWLISTSPVDHRFLIPWMYYIYLNYL